MTVVTATCPGCGAAVDRDVSAVPEGSWRDMLLRIEVRCEACAAAVELERQAEDDARAERDRRAQFDRRLRESGLPQRHHMRLEQLDHPDALIDAAGRWARDGGGLLATGQVGRGKTTIAGSAAYEALKRRAVIWTSAPLLFARLGSGFDSEQRRWALDTLANRRALVLDDIDKARPTEYAAEQVFLAVDQRVEHQVPLLVTSNLSPGELAGRWPAPYGEAIASRLVGYCQVLRVDGNDRRLK
jgi:DNA replication protein DnaC